MSNIIHNQPFESLPVTEPVVSKTVSVLAMPGLVVDWPKPDPLSGPIVTDGPHPEAQDDPWHNKQSLIQDIGTDNLIVRFSNLTLGASKYSGGTLESLNSNYFSSLTLGVYTNSIDTNAVQKLIQDNTQILQKPEQLASGSIFNYSRFHLDKAHFYSL
jgi:hypothetical protein